MPRIRFTLGRMMIAIAFVGVLLGVGIRRWMDRQDRIASIRYKTLSMEFGIRRDLEDFKLKNSQSSDVGNEAVIAKDRKQLTDRERSSLRNFELSPSCVSELVSLEQAKNHIRQGELIAAKSRAETALHTKKVEYLESLRRKYLYASQHPRLAVEPDPPEPK